jgi:hypothetical protein
VLADRAFGHCGQAESPKVSTTRPSSPLQGTSTGHITSRWAICWRAAVMGWSG